MNSLVVSSFVGIGRLSRFKICCSKERPGSSPGTTIRILRGVVVMRKCVEVVLNRDYGGFGLSKSAIEYYCKRKGIDVCDNFV